MTNLVTHFPKGGFAILKIFYIRLKMKTSVLGF